jgi:hypothetical protein
MTNNNILQASDGSASAVGSQQNAGTTTVALADSALRTNNISKALQAQMIQERLAELAEARRNNPNANIRCIAVFLAEEFDGPRSTEILQDFIQYHITSTSNINDVLDEAKRDFRIATPSDRLSDCNNRTSVRDFINSEVPKLRLGHYEGKSARVQMKQRAYNQADMETGLATWLESLRVRIMGDARLNNCGILEVYFKA